MDSACHKWKDSTIVNWKTIENEQYKYTCKKGFCGSDYDAVTGKYYYVNKLVKDTVKQSFSESEKYFYELIMLDEPYDTVYHFFETLFTGFNSFINVGYFEKLKQLYAEKELYYYPKHKDYTLASFGGDENNKTIPKGTKFTCTDVTIEDGGLYSIIYILENSEYGKMYVSDYDRTLMTLTKKEYDEIKRKKMY